MRKAPGADAGSTSAPGAGAERKITDFPAGWNEGYPLLQITQTDLLLTEGSHGGKELFVRCIGAEGLLLAVIQLHVQFLFRPLKC